MKKKPSHRYMKDTGRRPILAQMANESRLRLQSWVKHGCNAFDATNQSSNPMSFWTEQDVLQYILQNNIQIAPVYGQVFESVCDILITSGCNRTGCVYCGFGCHRDKRPNRFELIDTFSNRNLADYVLRGGKFCNDGLWRPSGDGLGYWFILKWINIYGKLDIFIPKYEEYETKFGNNATNYCLYGARNYENN